MNRELKTRILLTPVLALVIALIFGAKMCAESPYLFLLSFGITAVIVFVIWSGNVFIINYLHRKYPEPKQTPLRTLLTFLYVAPYSAVSFIVIEALVHVMLGQPQRFENFVMGLNITFYVTLPLTLIYESFFFYRQWEQATLDAEKLKRENAQAQLDSLRNQVNPHFLFNSLNTLLTVIPENTETAMEFTQKLANVYRYLLSVRDKELVELETELEFIEAYLFLLKVRFQQSLNVEVYVSEAAKKRLVPPVSLQLLIENAIKHNVVSAQKPLKVSIQSAEDSLKVSNNLQPKQQKEESTGVGLENIRKRYAILSNKTIEVWDENGSFSVLLPLLD
jgi:two-component system, LytTR family, sensor kinase